MENWNLNSYGVFDRRNMNNFKRWWIDIDKINFSIEICITIAFWLNEIAFNLNTYIKLNKIKPLLIKIDFRPMINYQKL